MTGLTMHDLANDVALSIRSLGDSPVVLLGHAFGNLLARMVTTDHPDMVKAVILAAAQGSAVPEDIGKTPFIAGDTFAPEADRIAALRKAFFALNHDATIWLDGWYPATLKMQRSALLGHQSDCAASPRGGKGALRVLTQWNAYTSRRPVSVQPCHRIMQGRRRPRRAHLRGSPKWQKLLLISSPKHSLRRV
jgi:pimeloyl-ACP methyl ester carboxylesterase